MLYYGKKIRASRDKFFFILNLVLSEIKIFNETKNHNPPPLKLNGRSLIIIENLNRCNTMAINCLVIKIKFYNFSNYNGRRGSTFASYPTECTKTFT